MHRFRIVRNVRLGVKNLLLHKLRSLLTVLGVVFGVASVIAMLAVGEGASQEAMEQIRKLGSNNLIITSVKPIEDDAAAVQHVSMNVYGLFFEDEDRIRQTIPHVKRTVPVKYVRKEGRLGERSLELRIVGTTPDWFDLVVREVIAGRVLTWEDSKNRAGVCVLTEHGARKLLAAEYAVGQFIRIGGDYYEVIGIVKSESGSGGIEAPDQQVDAYIPLEVLRERYGDRELRRSSGSMQWELVELHQILVEVESIDYVEAAGVAVKAMLARFHPKGDYKLYVPLTLLRQAEDTKRRFNIVLGSIAGISLLVGGIGIMNIMLASVTERTREIGIRRAIGAKRRQIVGQFLIETVVLSTVGGLIGIGIGILLPWLITKAAHMTTSVPAYGIVLALAVSVGVGIAFGIYPAIRAARLDPIAALRHE